LTIKRFLADNYDKPEDYYEVASPTGMSVAIIGSGPAGLTAAHQLAKEGHAVTIFEKQNILGGMLAVGIPEYRLPKDLLEEEIMDLQKFGIKFKTNVEFGKDQTYDDLMHSGYDAILIAHGAHAAKWIGIPGEDLPGSIHAVDFLRDVALGKEVNIGPKVIVVGGGDVAIDAVRVSTRLGCDAKIVYRRSLEEMPATKEEIDETMNEDIPINYLTNPVRIIGTDKVEAVELIKMELGEPDDSGRRRPIPIEGSEFIVPVDTVIQAVSQEPGMDGIKEQGFKTTRWNTFEVMDGSYKTNIYGVFAAGDNVSGPRTAIEAIKQAKDAATEIDEFLQQKIGKPLPEDLHVNKFE
jgi:NADPH-dependent glutamate synthase beta subunit-like oxidoreductase